MPRQTKPMTARRRAPDQIDLFAPRRIRNSTVTSICNGIPTWKPAGLNPLEHFVRYGRAEGRRQPVP